MTFDTSWMTFLPFTYSEPGPTKMSFHAFVNEPSVYVMCALGMMLPLIDTLLLIVEVPLPRTASVPVVVAPPLTVSPPAWVPLPTVDDANAVMPPLNCVRVDVALPASGNGYAAELNEERSAKVGSPSEEVATEMMLPLPFAYRSVSARFAMANEDEVAPASVVLPAKTFEPVKRLESARSVEEAAAIVISAVPSKEMPLMARAFWSAVAVPALPETEPVMVCVKVLVPEKVLFA